MKPKTFKSDVFYNARACSSVWSEHYSDKVGVHGSNPCRLINQFSAISRISLPSAKS